MAKARLPVLLARTLGGTAPAFSRPFPTWSTIDAHRRCHRGELINSNLQNLADAVTARLKFLTTYEVPASTDGPQHLPDTELEALDRHALAAFESGLYSIAVYFNEFVRAELTRRDERASAISTLEHQLSALAGIAGMRPLALSKYRVNAEHNPRALLYSSVHQSNSGDLITAQDTLARAEEILKGPQRHRREELELDLLLRRAQIKRSLRAAVTAYELAAASKLVYRANTARLIAGMISLATQDRSSADYFHAVLESGPGTSWLYCAESWFGLGYLALESSRLDVAYRYFIAAQFVFAVLGLQPMPHPDLALAAATGPTCMPADLLRDPRFLGLHQAHCLELRESAVKTSRLQRQVFAELAGWGRGGPLPDPVLGH